MARLYGRVEIARRFHIRPETIYNWEYARKIPLVKKRTREEVEALRLWINAQIDAGETRLCVKIGPGVLDGAPPEKRISGFPLKNKAVLLVRKLGQAAAHCDKMPGPVDSRSIAEVFRMAAALAHEIEKNIKR